MTACGFTTDRNGSQITRQARLNSPTLSPARTAAAGRPRSFRCFAASRSRSAIKPSFADRRTVFRARNQTRVSDDVGTAEQRLPDEDHPIQAFVLDRANKSLRVCIQVRCNGVPLQAENIAV